MKLRNELLRVLRELGPFAHDGRWFDVRNRFIAAHRCQWDTEFMMRILAEANGL